MSLLAQMGIRFCRQRRPIPAEPEPEDDPVTDPSVSSEGHSSADSQVEEQTVEATAVDPGVVVGAPVTLDLPRDSENFRLTMARGCYRGKKMGIGCKWL